MSSPDEHDGSWTLLTGHGHVLVEIARNPQARIRDISVMVGLTERSVQAIVADLKAAGYLTSTRRGRRTQYTVNQSSMFRHSAQEGLRVGPFLDLLAASADAAASEAAGEADAPPRGGPGSRGNRGARPVPPQPGRRRALTGLPQEAPARPRTTGRESVRGQEPRVR
jgi:DNA-binding MarR family transcriptional regulator